MSIRRIFKALGWTLVVILATLATWAISIRVKRTIKTQAPYFDTGAHFRGGLAPVRIRGKYGFIDKTGFLVIQPQFLKAGNFSEGVAWVTFGEPRSDGSADLGIIDQSGKLTPTPQIKTASYLILPKPFSEGLSAFTSFTKLDDKSKTEHVGDRDYFDKNDLIGYSNKAGMVVLQPMFISDCPFSGGLTSVVYAGSREHALIDTTPFQLVRLKYGFFGCFSEGLQGVVHARGRSISQGFVDRYGVVAVPLSESIGYGQEFSEGLTGVLINGSCAYVDRNGVITIPSFSCKFSSPFKEGVARVQLNNNRIGYVDKKGNWTIPATFTQGGDFSEGLALIERDGAQEFIDKTGTTVLAKSMITNKSSSTVTNQVEKPAPLADLNQAKKLQAQPANSIDGRDPGSLVDDPNLRPRFEKLLGPSFADFETRLEVSGLTERSGKWTVGSGLKPHSGGTDDAAFVIDNESSSIIAVMRVNHEIRVFGVDAVSQLPTPLTAWLQQ